MIDFGNWTKKCRYNETETDGKVKEILMNRSEGAGAQQEKVGRWQRRLET